MCREAQQMSPLEKLHNCATRLVQGEMGAGFDTARNSQGSAAYMRHMSHLLDKYFEGLSVE